MSTNIEIVKGVRGYVDADGVAQLNLEDIARGLGFTTVATSGNVCVRWTRVDKYLASFGVSMPTSGHDIFPECWERPEYIPEPIFYLLAMKAENETARAFQHTIAYEVLPAIRRHGLYAVDQLLDDPDLAIQAFTALKEERAMRKALEDENAQQKQLLAEYSPKASYYDVVLQTKDVMSTTQIAKDYGKSAKWMNALLHDKGVQFKQGGVWLLYQKYAEQGYTQSKTETYSSNDGTLHSKPHTYWTQKGRLFIYDLLKSEGILPRIEREENRQIS